MIHVRDFVRVVSITDTGPDDRIGDVGQVIRRVMDLGARPKDPLFLIRFPEGEPDVFWTEELKKVSKTRS